MWCSDRLPQNHSIHSPTTRGEGRPSESNCMPPSSSISCSDSRGRGPCPSALPYRTALHPTPRWGGAARQVCPRGLADPVQNPQSGLPLLGSRHFDPSNLQVQSIFDKKKQKCTQTVVTSSMILCVHFPSPAFEANAIIAASIFQFSFSPLRRGTSRFLGPTAAELFDRFC